MQRPPRSTLYPYATLFRSGDAPDAPVHLGGPVEPQRGFVLHSLDWGGQDTMDVDGRFALTNTVDVLRAIAEGKGPRDRKSTRLNSSHANISYAVFCLKKKK